MEFSKRLDLFGDEIFAALNERKVALEAQHVAHEILAERYEEQYADDASEQRGHEYLDERRAQLGILGLQDVDGRQGEDGPCDDSPRASL